MLLRLTVIGLIGLGIAFALLLYAHMIGYFDTVSNPIGYLEYSNGTVRRLAKEDLVWDRVRAGDQFGRGDTISTGEGVRAKLVLYAGGAIDIDPGSMIAMVVKGEEVELSFVTGGGEVQIQKKSTRKIKIKQRNKVKIRVKQVEKIAIRKPPPPKKATLLPVVEVEVEPEPKREIASIPVIPVPEVPLVKAVKEEEVGKKKDIEPDGEILLADKPIPEIIEEIIHKVLPIPQLIYPRNQQVIDLAQFGDNTPELKWRVTKKRFQKSGKTFEHQSPQWFEVVLNPIGGGRQRVIKTRQLSLSTRKIGKGKFTWSVRSVRKNGKTSSYAPQRVLDIRESAKISQPTIFPVKVD